MVAWSPGLHTQCQPDRKRGKRDKRDKRDKREVAISIVVRAIPSVSLVPIVAINRKVRAIFVNKE